MEFLNSKKMWNSVFRIFGIFFMAWNPFWKYEVFFGNF